jgi:hypothetical protein
MENIEELKADAAINLGRLKELSGAMSQVFIAGAHSHKGLDLEPYLCQDVVEMLARLWSVIDFQHKHIEYMHGVLDDIDKRIDDASERR